MEEVPDFFKIETAFNSLHLVRDRGRLELRSHDKALQSVINLDQPECLELSNLEHLLSVLLFIAAPERVLMLGTAGGSLLHFLRHHYPETTITSVDIDAELVERLLQLGILPGADARLNYVHADARQFIDDCDERYDLVIFDIFQGAQTPAWSQQDWVMQRLYELTASGGALAFNLLIESDHDFGLFYRNCKRRFDDCSLSLPVAGLENRVVYGVREPGPTNDMPQNLEAAMALSSRLDIDFMRILSVIYNTNPAGRGLI